MLQARRHRRWVAVAAARFGLLVLLSHSAAAAAPDSAPLGHAAESVSNAADTTSRPNMQLVYRGLASWGSNERVRRNALALPTARLRDLLDQAQVEQLRPWRQFRPRGPLRSVKNGLGFDYLFGAGLAMHFDVHDRRKLKRAGVRVRANSADPVAVDFHRRWSIGAALDPVRTEDGERFLRVVPQLRMNFDGMSGPGTHCRGLVEFGYWRGGDKYVTSDEQVLQASLKMTF